MGPKLEWSNYMMEELIAAFKKRERLWNTKTPAYRDRAKKYKAWRELANEIGQTEEDCRRKMDSLLASFRRERFRVAKSASLGEEELYKPRWIFYNHLLFTKGLEAEADLNSLESPSSAAEDDDNNEEDDEKSATTSRSPRRSGARRRLAASGQAAPPTTAAGGGRYKRLRHSAEETATNAANATATSDHFSNKSPQSQQQASVETRQDSYDIFGKYVASELRGLDEKSLAAVKHQISTSIFEAKINMHNNPTIVNVITEQAVVQGEYYDVKEQCS